MAATRTSETRLSDEDVAKVMGLIKGSDTVELKLTVPESEHSGTDGEADGQKSEDTDLLEGDLARDKGASPNDGNEDEDGFR